MNDGQADSGSRRVACLDALVRASNWIVDSAQIHRDDQEFENPEKYPHGSFLGAMRTEYDTSTQLWTVNGPVFHSGQAIRALMTANRRTGDHRFMESALLAGEFLMRERIDEPGHPHNGLL